MSAGVGKIQVFDPVAMDAMKQFGPQDDTLIYTQSNYQAVADADALILLTQWDEFYAPDWKRIQKSMTGKLIIDARNIWSREIVENYEFKYVGIGR